MPTFLVEDGTGLALATSYVDEAFADDYLGASWAADSAAKEAALMSATEYAEARWGHLLKGRPLISEQNLELPRRSLYDRYGRLIEGVPTDWKKAVTLYAKESVDSTLYPTPPSGSAKEVKKKKTVVGPITTETEYLGVATASTYLDFPLADRLARQFTVSSGGGGVMRN